MSSGLSRLNMFSSKENSQKDDPMLGLFLSMLDVRVRSIEAQVGQDSYSQTLLSDLKVGISKLQKPDEGPAELSSAAAWNEAYRLERLLAAIEPAETLDLELKRRVNEAIDADLPSIQRIKSDVDIAMAAAYDRSKLPPVLNPNGNGILRSALLNLLEEIHWQEQRNFYAGPIQKSAAQRIVLIGLCAFILVMVPYGRIYYVIFHKVGLDLQSWSWFPLYTVITTGAFGAFFSRLTYILQHWDRLPLREIQSAKGFMALFLRGSVGMCGAVVVFFFLKSGLVSGPLFPTFGDIGVDVLNYPVGDTDAAKAAAKSGEVMQVIVPSKDLALLVLWSFVAGFSERLVPSILSRTETSFEGAASGVGGSTSK